MLQRWIFLAVLPLCISIVIEAARAAPPLATPDVSPSAAPAPDNAPERPDWHDRFEWPHHGRTHDGWAHYGRHGHDSGRDQVNIGHDSILPSGQQADSIVSILGDARIDGEVNDSAVTVLGNTYIDGKIDGDAVAVLGNMELGPHAEIGGNVVAVGGTLQRDPAAIVRGNVQHVFAGNFGSVGWLRTWVHHCLFYGRPLALAPGLGWAWGLALACLAFYAGLALLFRDGLTRCVQTFETQPGHSVLAALIAMLLTPVLVVLLCVTVIGIAAVPFVVFGLFCAALFGKAVMLAWLGRRVAGRHGEGAMSHPAVAVLIGGMLVLVLYLVPVLGLLVYKLLGLLGLGAVVYTLIQNVRAHQAAKEAPRSSTTAPGPTPMPRAAPETDAAPPVSATPTATAAAVSAAPISGAVAASGGADAMAGTPGSAPTAPAPQSVTAVLPRAGFWIRMAALLIDALLIGFLMGVLHRGSHLELLVLAAYGAIMWKTRGSTIGGIVFDLRVGRSDGREIDWETAIVRALGCFLSLAVAGLGFIWIAFDGNRQAWHDKIAGTVVVRVPKGVPLV